jgi:hypothetical protein
MSAAIVNRIDEQARVVHISFSGVREELLANMRCYGIKFLPTLTNRNTVGIPYKAGLGKEAVALFAKSAMEIIDIWTMRGGVTKRIESDFARSFLVVTANQADSDDGSEEGRQISEWIRRQVATAGGAA